jgi:hypothetical protein
VTGLNGPGIRSARKFSDPPAIVRSHCCPAEFCTWSNPCWLQGLTPLEVSRRPLFRKPAWCHDSPSASGYANICPARSLLGEATCCDRFLDNLNTTIFIGRSFQQVSNPSTVESISTNVSVIIIQLLHLYDNTRESTHYEALSK